MATEEQLKIQELKDEIEQYKKEKKDQDSEINRFNEALLGEIKSVASREVYQLVRTQISSVWGKFTRLETTDAILVELNKVIVENKNKQSEEIKLLKQKAKEAVKQIETFKKNQLEFETYSKEAEENIEKLTKIVQENLTKEKELKNNLEESKEFIANYKKEIQQLRAKEETHTELEEKVLNLNNKIEEKESLIKILKAELEELIESNLDLSVKVEAEISNIKTKRSPLKCTPNKAMSYETISKTIARIVPQFSGARTPELASRVHEFVNACELAFDCIGQKDEEIFVSLLSTRLVGDAFELVRCNNVKTLNNVIKLIKNTYLTARSLDSVIVELKQTRQLITEDIKSFSRRLLSLKNIAKEIIEASYSAQDSVALISEITNSLVTSFKIGLADPSLRQFMLSSTETDLDRLVDTALKTSLLLQPQYMQMGMYPHMQILQNPQVPSVLNPQISLPQQNPTQFDSNPFNVNNFNQMHPQYGQIQTQTQNQWPHQHNNLSLPNYNHLNPTIPNFNPQITPMYSQDSILQQQEPENTPATQSFKRRTYSPQYATKCGFCNKPNHTYAECRQRRNTPYCGNCNAYGHGKDTCPKSKILVTHSYKSKMKCRWCSRTGHLEENCFSKKNYNKQEEGNDQGAGNTN